MKRILLVSSLLFMVGCGSKNSEKNEKLKLEAASHSLFNLSTMYSDAEQNVSFPLWFNDSIIRARGITSVIRSVFEETKLDTIESKVSIPKRKLAYTFGKLGELKQLIVSNYYDDKVISTIKIVFSNHDENTGFSQTRINDELENADKEFPYIQMNVVLKNEDVSVYKNPLTSQRLFIIKNEKHWKPLSVDKLCNPNKNDLILFGNYKSPTKKYKVQNLVEETDVHNFEYVKSQLKEILWKDDPFNVKRSFKYDSSGQCVGFIDSTFSIGNFVSKMHYSIQLKDGIPISVQRSVFRDTKEIILFSENFEYTYKD